MGALNDFFMEHICHYCKKELDPYNFATMTDDSEEFLFCNKTCWYNGLNGLEKAKYKLEKKYEGNTAAL